MSIALPEEYELTPLNPASIAQVIELQSIVIDDLPPDRKYDISHRTSEEFEKRMTVLGKMHGVYHKPSSQLVAYSTLALPTKDWPVGDMAIDPSMAPCSPEQLAISQNSVVHPMHRGKSLHVHLLKAKLDLCGKLSRQHVIGQVLSHNATSLKGLLKADFHVASASITPLRKCKALNVHKDLGNPILPYKQESVMYVDPMADFELLMALLEHGYIGLEIFRSDVSTPAPEGYLLKIAKTTEGPVTVSSLGVLLSGEHKVFIDFKEGCSLFNDLCAQGCRGMRLIKKSWSQDSEDHLWQVHLLPYGAPVLPVYQNGKWGMPHHAKA